MSAHYWMCVEYVRAYLQENPGYISPSVGARQRFASVETRERASEKNLDFADVVKSLKRRGKL